MTWFRQYRTETLVGVGTFILAIAIHLFSALRYSNDDQFILYRYIDNIAAGHGFVYNLGEHVLGSTTPLFTLVAAFLKYIFHSILTPNLVAYLNIVLLSAAAVLFYRLCLRFLSFPYALFAALIFALNLARIIPEGMETALFLVTTFAFLENLFEGRHYRASVFLALSILTRPDAGLIALLAAIYWFVKSGWKQTVRIGAVAFLVVLPWLLFATFYFGSFIPQSLVAKTHTNDTYEISALQGAKVQSAHISRLYWGKIFDPEAIPLQVAFNLLPTLILFGLGVWGLIKRNRETWLIILIPLLYFVSFAISNPLIFPWYLSQIEPFWIMVTVAGIALLASWSRVRLLGIVLALALLLGPLFGYLQLLTTKDPGSKQSAFAIAEYLNAHMKEDETLGVADIGIVGYETNAYIVDFIGLVSPDSVPYYPVERECSNEMFVIPPKLIQTKQPDWIVAGESLEPCFRESAWFKEHYTMQQEFGSTRFFHKN